MISGAGGGFDIYSGLPLFFHLRARGKEVHLANLSFTSLAEVSGGVLAPGLVEVDAGSSGPRYFPERALARYLAARGERTPVFCFEAQGCQPLLNAYRTLADRLVLDAIVLVDGGTDILMRGDEAGLGTPVEDIASLAAGHALDVTEKVVVCVGFGIDSHHGVCHAHFLENVAQLARESAFLGAFSLLAEMPEVVQFREAVRFAAEQMPTYESIVTTSLVSAIEGEYGDVHRVERTAGSTLWINPLMSMYWAFDLDAVARNCLYLAAVQRTVTRADVASVIEAFRETIGATRERRSIPS
jgi:hypothetical protein